MSPPAAGHPERADNVVSIPDNVLVPHRFTVTVPLHGDVKEYQTSAAF